MKRHLKKFHSWVRDTSTGRFVRAAMAKLDPRGTVTETEKKK